MATLMSSALCDNPPTQHAAEIRLRKHTTEFLQSAFYYLWHEALACYRLSAEEGPSVLEQVEDYEELAILAKLFENDWEIKTAAGGDYLITPDITVSRQPLTDAQINAGSNPPLVDSGEQVAKHTPLRAANRARPHKILHASISCKWAIRSDRAQNSRTEALNLIRNRKGRTPHIAVVMFEPLPARIASIAMGTGDIDCTYHGALYELLEAAREGHHSDALDLLQTLVDGRRLRDISDLPFDLAM